MYGALLSKVEVVEIDQRRQAYQDQLEMYEVDLQ